MIYSCLLPCSCLFRDRGAGWAGVGSGQLFTDLVYNLVVCFPVKLARYVRREFGACVCQSLRLLPLYDRHLDRAELTEFFKITSNYEIYDKVYLHVKNAILSTRKQQIKTANSIVSMQNNVYPFLSDLSYVSSTIAVVES
ncbi:hypothetical protein J6590_089688 [Homalodisca vitripennis]|nr:hypothetical protein J6590_089688 [Homalodisca vitripennis]